MVIFEYHYSPDYRKVYATGARGGFQSGYHLNIDFYHEKTRRSTKQKLVPKNEREGRIEDIDPADPPIVDREYIVGIDLSIPAARQLARWLNERVSELEMMEKEIQASREAGGNE